MSTSFSFTFATPDPPEPDVPSTGGGDAYPSQTVESLRDAAIQLLPPGKALSKEPTSNIGKLLEAMSVEFWRVSQSAESLFRNRIAGNASELLDEWEAALGLTTDATETIRQGAVVAKIRGRGQHSQQAFVDAAAALGYTGLTFTKYPPTIAGTAVAGDECIGDLCANVVTITTIRSIGHPP
jgi:uncharacterized protein YmfQ (DUF2313 family)